MSLYLGSDKISNMINHVPPVEKDVNFYDYDGTLLYSYNRQEVLDLVKMPLLPDRTNENLTNEGWNYTLNELKSTINSGYHCVSVGCTYHTTDNITYIYANPIEGQAKVVIGIKSEIENDTTIDWGDGSTTTPSTSSAARSHTYSSDYYGQEVVIKITSVTGTHSFHSYFFGVDYANNVNNRITSVKFSNKSRLISGTYGYLGFVNMGFLRTIALSKYNYDGVNYYTSLFSTCCSLQHVNIPSTFVINGTRLFQNCYILKSASVPQEVTESNAACYNCYLLNKSPIKLSSSATDTTNMFYSNTAMDYLLYLNANTIGDRVCFNSYSIKTIVLSSNVANINYRAFQTCTLLESIYLKATTPPVLSSTFTAPNSFYYIYVPAESLATYQAESNWSNIASRIRGYDYTLNPDNI